jgi:hypothetical protein
MRTHKERAGRLCLLMTELHKNAQPPQTGILLPKALG